MKDGVACGVQVAFASCSQTWHLEMANDRCVKYYVGSSDIIARTYYDNAMCNFYVSFFLPRSRDCNCDYLRGLFSQRFDIRKLQARDSFAA